MSMALRCNRCKKFFDPADPESEATMRFGNPVIFTPKAIEERRVEGYLYEGGGQEITVDLCSECTPWFISFMEGKEMALEVRDKKCPVSIEEIISNCSKAIRDIAVNLKD